MYSGLSPPLGLLYLAKILEQDGNKVSMLDFSAEKFETNKLMSALLSVDAVCMTIMSTLVQKADKMIRQIKEKDPELPIIIGGPHCTLFPKRALEETQADMSVQGDGEKVILNIKKALMFECNDRTLLYYYLNFVAVVRCLPITDRKYYYDKNR